MCKKYMLNYLYVMYIIHIYIIFIRMVLDLSIGKILRNKHRPPSEQKYMT
jgi:hypothetical protein